MINYTEQDIQKLLFDIGIPVNRLGFLYLTYGMSLVMADYEYATRVSKLLYVDIAARYKTEPVSVDRCIRHAIFIAYERNRNALMCELFNSDTYKKMPTPSEFITRVYFYMINMDTFSDKEKEA